MGIDPYTDKKGGGSMVMTKQTPQGMEVIKVLRWYDKFKWFQRLRVKFYIWQITNRFARYYKKVEVFKETNDGIENLKSHAAKPRMFDGLKFTIKTDKTNGTAANN